MKGDCDTHKVLHFQTGSNEWWVSCGTNQSQCEVALGRKLSLLTKTHFFLKTICYFFSSAEIIFFILVAKTLL